MELCLLSKFNRLKFVIFCLLFFGLISNNYGQTITDRVYASSANRSDDDFLLILRAGYVQNTNSAVDQDLTTYATLNSTTVNVLGASIGGESAIRLNFPSTLPANTPVTVKLGIGGDVLSALQTVQIQAINGNATSSDASGNEVGPLYAVGNLVSLLNADQQIEVSFTPSQQFTGVKISLGGGSGLLSAGVLTQVDVYEAYYNQNVGATGCLEPEDALVGVEGNFLDINAVSALDIIQNPYNAIDGDENTSALLQANVSALNLAYLKVPFNGESKPGDQIQIILQDQAAGLLDLGLLSSNFQVIAYNDNLEVARFNGGSSLISLELLSGSSSKYVLSLPVNQSFDEVEIQYGGGLATLFSGIRIFEVATAPGTPAITSDDIVDNSVEICENEELTLSVLNPESGSTYNWYTQADGGTAVATGVDFIPLNLNAGSYDYYVAQTRPGCSNESTRAMVSVEVGALPDTPVLVDNSIEVASGGNATFEIENPNSNLTYNWYAEGDNASIIHTGTNYQINNITASTSYTVRAVSGLDCESGIATANITLLGDLLPPEVLPANATVSQGETTILMASSENSDPVVYAWFDEDDVEVFVGENFVTPSDLSPGTYTYNVISRNPDTNQESMPTQVTLIVQPVSSLDDCSAANAQNNGVDGLLCVLCGVINAGNPVDNNPDNFSQLRVTVGVGASVYQELIFPQAGVAGDSIRLDLGIPGGLADVNLLGGIQATLYNGTTQVDQFTLDGALVSLNVLGGERFVAEFEASNTYDRVEIRNLGLVSALTTTNIYGAYIKVPQPAITSPDINNGVVEVCAEEDFSLSIDNPSEGSTYRWYDTAEGGTPIFTGTTYDQAGLSAGTYQFYVSQSLAGCSTESIRTSIEIGVEELPVTPVLVEENINVISGGDVTFEIENPDAKLTYNWYAEGDATIIIHTGETYEITNVTASAGYTVRAISDAGCESEAAIATINLLPDLLAPTVVPSEAIISEGETVTFTASSENPDPVVYAWFDEDGVEVFVGENFTTPSNLSPGTYTYDVISRNPDTGQESESTQVVIIVEPIGDLNDCTAANAQNNGIDGLLCVLCGVTNAGNAVDNDPDNFSRLSVSVGVAASVYQELIFPQAGISGDNIRLDLGIPSGLADVGILSGIQLTLFNGSTQVNQFTLDASLVSVNVLGGDRFTADFEANGTYDRVEVRNLGLVTALTSLDIYGAYILVPEVQVDNNTVEICSGETVDFNIATEAGLSYAWYDSETGGSLLATGGSYSTSEINTSQIFYLEISRNTCPIQDRIPFEVEVLPTATEDDIVVNDLSICAGGSVALKASSSISNPIFTFYSDAELTSEITNLTVTPTVTTTYYVTVSGDEVCENLPSDAAMITVAVSDPGTPTTDMAMQSFCAPATVADLMTNEGNVVWYADETGADILDESTTLQDGMTYYAGFDPASGCASSELLAVTVEILPTATESDIITTDLEICLGESFELSASSAIANPVFRYYTNASLTSEITNLTLIPTFNGTYYVTVSGDGLCENLPGDAATITVTISNPGTPTTDMPMQSFCTSTTVADLMTNEGNVVWYADETGGDILDESTTLQDGTTYYAGFDPASGCASSALLAVEVEILPTATESDLVTMDYDICIGGSVELEATTSVANATLTYYTDADLTNEITDLTVMPTVTTTYYVSVSGDGVCENLPGDAATITVTISNPGTPTTDMPMQSFCTSATVADLMTNEGNVVWYADEDGTTLFAQDEALVDGTTYYAGFDPTLGCPSNQLLAVQVEILPTATEDDIIVNDLNICTGGNVDLVASSSITNPIFTFYSDAELTSEITNLNVSPTVTTTYYVTISGDGLCENLPGDAAMITVTVSDPGTPTTDMAMQSFCAEATVADLMTNEGNVVWYADETGGDILDESTTLQDGMIYYAAFDPASGCSGSERLAVTVDFLPTATASDIAVNDSFICSGGNVILTATSSISNPVFRYYTDAALTSEITDLTVMPTSTTTYYVTVSGDEICENLPGEAATLQVIVSDPGTPTTALPNQSFCAGATVADIQVNESNVVWYASADATSPIAQNTQLENGMTYYAGFDPASGCSSSQRLAVTVSLLTDAVASINGLTDDICLMEEVTYTTESGKEDYLWDIEGGEITAGGGLSDNSVTVRWTSLLNTSVSVSYMDNGSCSAELMEIIDINVVNCSDLAMSVSVDNFSPMIGEDVTFTIRIDNLGNVDFSDIVIRSMLPEGYSIKSVTSVMGQFSMVNMNWTIPILQAHAFAEARIVAEVTEEDAYMKVVELMSSVPVDPNASNNRAQITVNPLCLVVYNEFTPNNDGSNDVFRIDCIENYPNNKLEVYNRYGDLVYETRGYQNDWDGTANRGPVLTNKPLPVGTYYYILQVDGRGEVENVNMQGWLYIMR